MYLSHSFYKEKKIIKGLSLKHKDFYRCLKHNQFTQKFYEEKINYFFPFEVDLAKSGYTCFEYGVKKNKHAIIKNSISSDIFNDM